MQTILRHSFSKLNLSKDIGLSLSINRESYYNFLFGGKSVEYSIENALQSVFPVVDDGNNIEIDYLGYRIEEPTCSVNECKIKNFSYVSKLYIKIRESFFEQKEGAQKKTLKYVKEREIFACDLPRMTDLDSFIIDGIEKVIVSQIYKAPGVIFSKDIYESDYNYVASITPYAGNQLKIEYSKKYGLTFSLNRSKKKSIYFLLRALSISNEEIIENLYQPLKLSVQNKKISFAIDLSKYVGVISSINIRDEGGKILIKKGENISKLAIRKLKDCSTFYCNNEDLDGLYLFNTLPLTNNETLHAGEVLGGDIVKKIASKEKTIKSFQIVNPFSKTYDVSVLEYISENTTTSDEDCIKEVFKSFKFEDYVSLNDAKKTILDTFFSQSRFDLHLAGRHKLNQVLGLNIPEECNVLTKEDIFATIVKLIAFKNGLWTPEDVDSLSNKKIRSAGELVYLHFLSSLKMMLNKTKEIMNNILYQDVSFVDYNFFNTKILDKGVRNFFLLSDLCQFMDQNNLLSSLAHIRKITALGEGGVQKEAATGKMRDINSTHYGRICPIETPDGQNIGLVTNFACYSKVDKYGAIRTPFFKVDNGTITKEIVYLDVLEEEEFKIVDLSNEFFSANSEELVSARYHKNFILVPKKDVQYIDVSAQQIVSISATLIPFIESNDTARALMGCNMQKQAVPLLFRENPFVATGFEKKIFSGDSSFLMKAESDSEVIFVDSNQIVTKDINDDSVIKFYNLNTFDRTNQSTFANQKAIVKIGEKVKKNQTIADCASSLNCELSLGKNILLAFMPWNGYNYEDSVVISNRLLKEDTFTSIHIEEYTISVVDTFLGVEKTTRDVIGVSEEKTHHLDESGIVVVGTRVKGGDILVGKVTPLQDNIVSSEEKLLQSIFGDKTLAVKDNSLYVPIGTEGTVVDVKILTNIGKQKEKRAQDIERAEILKIYNDFDVAFNVLKNIFKDKLLNLGFEQKQINEFLAKSNVSALNLVKDKNKKEVLMVAEHYIDAVKKLETNKNNALVKAMECVKLPTGTLQQIKVYVAVKSKIQPGDKISGRHGNKGVISRCVAVEDMPYMEDGTPIDLVFSSVSVPGRMNIGQILETHLGFLSYSIGKKISKMLEEKTAADNIRKLLNDISTDEQFTKQINSKSDKEIIELGKSYQKGFYFETPIFDGCKIKDIDNIADKLGIDKSLQVDLYDGLSGEKFDRKVTVGYMYIIKLHHLVDEKIHARSIGSYSVVTQQPLGGRSNFGGQRVGEMECWAFQAYGAAYTLQEIMTVKSDDVRGRKEIYQNIINCSNRFISGIPESFNVLCREFMALGLDVEFGVNG